jgi:hypothetical protein
MAGPKGREDVMNAGEQLIQRGVQQGRLETLRPDIAAVLSARGVTCSEGTRSKLAACSDAVTLTHWLIRAATALSEGEVFADGDGS